MLFCCQKRRCYPQLVVKEMGHTYVKELKDSITTLVRNWESVVPVSKGIADVKPAILKVAATPFQNRFCFSNGGV